MSSIVWREEIRRSLEKFLELVEELFKGYQVADVCDRRWYMCKYMTHPGFHWHLLVFALSRLLMRGELFLYEAGIRS